MKLTKDLMKATGETIAVCEQLDVDPRLVARVLLGVVDWAEREPELEPEPEPKPEVTRSRFRDVPIDPERPWRRYTAPVTKPAQEAPPPAPWQLDPESQIEQRGHLCEPFTDQAGDCQACNQLEQPVATPSNGERDAKGRKVVKRDSNWRENTLQRMQVGESVLMSYLLEQLPGVTRGAMAQRMAMLVAEGHLEQIGPGSWRRIK